MPWQVQEMTGQSGDAVTRSFCNTWVDHLALHLPPLAVAIDDSLMALVERCVKHLASPALPARESVQPTGYRDRPGLMGRADPRSPGPSWTPSASSPMTLLEQARQARQLNDALDSFGARRQAGKLAVSLFAVGSLCQVVCNLMQTEYIR